MDNAQDTRPHIAGYILPLSITTDPIMGEYVVDADGEAIINFAEEYDGDFYKELITKVNRTAALETALVLAFSALEKATGDEIRDAADEEAIVEGLRETLTQLGLTDRLEASRS